MVEMTRRITFPLRFAIFLSQSAGALYRGIEGHLTIQTLEGWLITGELHHESICEEYQEYEEYSWYLASRKIVEDRRWIPEPLAFVSDDS